MKQKYSLLVFLITISISCTHINNTTMKNKGEFPVNISNKELVNEVKEYYKSNLAEKNFKYVISISYSQQNETDIFMISYDMNLFSLINNPPLYYCKIENFDVIIRTNLTNYFIVSNDYLEELSEKLFPIQYEQYKVDGEVPPPITFRCEEWILKFKGDNFLGKEIL